MSELHKKLLKSNPAFGGLPPRPTAQQSGESLNRRAQRANRDYSPLPWENYFDRKRDVSLSNGNTFRVYVKGDSGPVFFFLHGGGFSGLSWSLLASVLVKKIICQCYSLDIRGHG